MKSIANQYRDLKEGRMSQANFMRNLRMSMPQYVTNVTSFKDAVRILKSKSILTESGTGDNQMHSRAHDMAAKLKSQGQDKEEVYQFLVNKQNLEGAVAQSMVDDLFGIDESGHGDAPISKMSRKDMIDFLGTTEEKAKDMSDQELRDAVEDKNEDLKENVDNEAKEIEIGNPEVKVGDIVVPNKGPHEGRTHEVIAIFPDGSFNIKPKWAGLKAADIKYKLGAAKAKPEDVEVLAEVENSNLRSPEGVAELVANKHADKLIALRPNFKEFENAALNFAGQEMLASGMNKVAVRNLLSAYGYFEDWAPDFIDALDNELETQSMIAKGEEEESGKYTTGDEQFAISEAKKKKAEPKAELHPNKIHPQELRMGIKVELEHTDDLDKAKKIALDHLAENPFYYTALKLSGIESPSAPKAKAPVKKKAKKSNKIELVDLVNGMKKVKMPKAEEKKKLKEAKLNIDGEPNAVVKQAMAYVDSNPMLKIISDDIEFQQSSNPNEAILRYGYWEELPDEAIAKLELQFNVEEDLDYDTNTGNMFMYLLTPKANTDSSGLGASFDKFKSQLEEMIREAITEIQSDEQEIDNIAMSMDETFDGRDNLADEIAAQQK